MNSGASLSGQSKTTTARTSFPGTITDQVLVWVVTAGIVILLCLVGCSSNQAPAARSYPTTAAASQTAALAVSHATATALPATATPRPTASPSPFVAPTPTASPKDERDAFSVFDFPWADPSQQVFPRTAGGGKAKVVNSVFFEGPHFFGFDFQTTSGWYHVSGGDHWATLDGRRISPTLLSALQPRDGDSMLVYGTADGQFVEASLVGYADGTVWYYRSLLSAAELLSGKLPAAYDGLQVWVRGRLADEGEQPDWYRLPPGATLGAKRAGQEALLGGKLQYIHGKARLDVTQGIYVLDQGKYVKVLASAQPEPRFIQQQGIILAIEASGRSISLQCTDGEVLQVIFTDEMRVEFADGSPAGPSELLPGRLVLVTGKAVTSGQANVSRIGIISAVPRGRAQAAYLAGPNRDLWSIQLDMGERGRIRRQITRLDAPEAGLADAVFSPDGSSFVFTRANDAGSVLVLGDVASGELRELLTDDQWQERDPNWSPEGGRIVFCRDRVDGQERLDAGLWTLNLNLGTPQRLGGESPAGWLNVGPRWSPDGTCIAYAQVTAGSAQPGNLFVLTLPSDRRQVLEHVFEWRWSADSTQLVCTRQAPDESRARLWVVQKDGTSPTWLSPTRGIDDRQGRVSPDGSAIAFLTRPEGSKTPGSLGIMQSDGTRRVQVEGRPLASRLAWAPDSQSVIFLAVNQDGESEGLWTVTRSGFGLRALVVEIFAFVGTYREAD